MKIVIKYIVEIVRIYLGTAYIFSYKYNELHLFTYRSNDIYFPKSFFFMSWFFLTHLTYFTGFSWFQFFYCYPISNWFLGRFLRVDSQTHQTIWYLVTVNFWILKQKRWYNFFCVRCTICLITIFSQIILWLMKILLILRKTISCMFNHFSLSQVLVFSKIISKK